MLGGSCSRAGQVCDDDGGSVEDSAASELACAIAHEVGNHLGGIRLEAHLLDDELDVAALARSSLSIDALAARSGPLLALLRPLLSPRPPGDGGSTALLERVASQIGDEGTRGILFEVRAGDPLAAVPATDWLHPLLVALVQTTIEVLDAGDRITLSLESDAGLARIVCEDDGPPEDLSETAARRGRGLVLAIARELVGRTGGRVEVLRASDRTRVVLGLRGA